MLARQIRFTCPHCGTVNRAPVRSIGRGGACVRCGGGIKVPSAHAVESASDDVETQDHEAFFELAAPFDLIGTGFERALVERSLDDDASAPLFDLGRPSRPTRSVTAPSATVAEATMLPTASQLASSDRADRSTVPPVQTLRTLRRFAPHSRPRRHVAARRQQPGTPWWAWMAQGALSIGAIYALATVYNGGFNTQVNAVTFPRIPAMVYEADGSEGSGDPLPGSDAPGTPAPVETETRVVSPGDAAVADLIAKTAPHEKIWVRHERILLSDNEQLYAVVRVKQTRDGRIRIDRNETSDLPTDFPEDAALIDRRPATRPAGSSIDTDGR